MVYIYKLENELGVYIGSSVDPNKRYNTHLSLLRNEKHYNKKLTEMYKNGREIKLSVIKEVNASDRWEEEKKEIRKIPKEKKANISGGAGREGLRRSKAERSKLSERFSGDKNPQSKLTEEDFLELLEMFRQGKNNKEISSVFNIHDRYVSLIRSKRRLLVFWNKYAPNESYPSPGRKKDIDYKSFLEIIEMLQEGYTNKDIATVFGIDPSVVSRIKNKKIYREHFDKMSGSTTIEKIAKART